MDGEGFRNIRRELGSKTAFGLERREARGGAVQAIASVGAGAVDAGLSRGHRFRVVRIESGFG